MVWHYHGQAVPMEIYHGVPKGWLARELIQEHARLGGSHDIAGPDASEPGAPSWLPARYDWLQYRKTLYRIADGMLAGDAACVELAVRFIELRHIGSYSGFIRAKLSRRLKHCSLSAKQRERLHAHFSGLVMRGDRCDEFRNYLGLWRRLISPSELLDLAARLKAEANGDARAKWLVSELTPLEPAQGNVEAHENPA